jgi:hypothetical protein
MRKALAALAMPLLILGSSTGALATGDDKKKQQTITRSESRRIAGAWPGPGWGGSG